MACNHCQTAACITACPVGAIFREDNYGAVLVDDDRCVGSKQCAVACPYGAPQYADDAPGTVMQKCNMCIDKLAMGQRPQCVETCPSRALDFDTLDNLKAKYGTNQQLEGMPDPSLTQPSLIVKPTNTFTTVVAYPVDEALRLLQNRGVSGLPLVYPSTIDPTATPPNNTLDLVPTGGGQAVREKTRDPKG